MRIDTTFMRSKVARRIFLLFICCALIPITALALFSFGHITRQLNVTTQRQLHQTSKDIGMYIYERLLFLEAEMKMVASVISTMQHTVSPTPAGEFTIDWEQHFRGFALINESGTPRSLLGRTQAISKLTQPEKRHILSGKAVISTSHQGAYPQRSIFMSILLDPQQPSSGVLVGEINPLYLWGTSDENPWIPAAELCILDHAQNILFSTLPPPLSFPEEVMHTIDSHASGQFEWEHDKNQYVAGYWALFLKPQYYTSQWIVVLSEAKTDVLAPAARFKKTFPFIIFMTLLMVLLLSIIQIRRNLVPLEKLQEGTRHIAQRKFDSRVTIKTGDEFEELAASFNTMADQLSKQFKTLTTIAEIDRAILSTLDTEKIIEVVLNRIHDILPCDCVSVMLFHFGNQDSALTYIREKGSEIGKEVETVLLKPIDLKELYRNPEFFVTEVSLNTPDFLTPLVKRGNKSFLVFPLFIKQMLSGIIALGYQTPPSYNQEDIAHVRRLVDQVAVSLSNTRLVEELEQLHWGTLTALARAIDAKSSWTSGHSERVTKLALKIGSALGIPPKESVVLRRGGLLHDIGKIGVPAEILDRSGKLNEKEDQLIREHVRWGARILEPIAAFAEIMPIVLQHHEHFDGTGYPEGLAGEAIHLNARILAVADTFDALSSDRPYRQATGREQAIEIIKEGAGSQFDPQVVLAFLEVMREEQRNHEYTTEYAAETM
jgi:putative nucleotidyltransferase with HDIG domain